MTRALKILGVLLLVFALGAAVASVQAGSGTGPPIVAALDAHTRHGMENLKVAGDPWTDPCVPCTPRRADLNVGGAGILGGVGLRAGGWAMIDYPLLA